MSPSSNLPSWTHFSKPQHGWLRPFLCGLLAGLVLALLPWQAMVLWALAWFGSP